jgi:hypothetical protein
MVTTGVKRGAESGVALSRGSSINPDRTYRYCGRIFTVEEIEQIRCLIASHPKDHRAELSRLVCDELRWLRPDGRRKDMSCRVAMLRMENDGLIKLPAPLKGNGNGHNRPRLTAASEPQEPVTGSVGSLRELSLRPVETSEQSTLWNELIERYHYLGYKPLPGAQLRYLVFTGDNLIAALGFGAAAWRVAPRDRFIGWTDEQRERNLHLVVGNARFLILPWITVRNLASRILATVAKQLPKDWHARYGFRPVLLETFVQRERFRGTCYRAANWIYVGQTQGRGKLDRKKLRLLPVKDIYLRPLHRRFRKDLA